MEWNFKFEPGQKVKTDLGHIGIVEDCNINQTHNSLYFVFTGDKASSRWYAEYRL